MEIPARVEHIYISKGHNFIGRHNLEPLDFPMSEVAAVECLVGRGLAGDRHLDRGENHKGQVTFFSAEVHELVEGTFHAVPASVYRRNVIVRGADLNALIGSEFELQGIRFEGVEESSPCYWMDRVIAPGAKEFLRGRGGLRARIVTDGTLRCDRGC